MLCSSETYSPHTTAMKNNSLNSHSNSASGLATMVGIAGLGHPRPVADAPKSLMLDAEIYLGSPSCEALIGALRFYNGQNIKFTDDLTLYLIYATVNFLHISYDFSHSIYS